MQYLDLYKSRKHSVVKLNNGIEYKIPKEYTVEEVERLLELALEQERIEAEEVIESQKKRQLANFDKVIFAQLLIIFQHYQPEVNEKQLKKDVTQNEALEMVGFFTKYRDSILNSNSSNEDEPKKKDYSASTELRDLRRIITFMVVNGFSLFEMRKLYIDELYDYYEHLFYNLEMLGKIKEGSYDKIVSRKQSSRVEDTVALLRKQIFMSVTPKKKNG